MTQIGSSRATSQIMLLLMIVICGMMVYIAMEMRKRLEKADALMQQIEVCADNIVQKDDFDQLNKTLSARPIKKEPESIPSVDLTTNDELDNKITILPAKKRKKVDGKDN